MQIGNSSVHMNNLCAQTIKKCSTLQDAAKIFIILALEISAVLCRGTRWSEGASCWPACRSDLWACIFPPSLRLMSDYHSCSCPSCFFFYCEDKCVTYSVITQPTSPPPPLSPRLLSCLHRVLSSPPKIYPLPLDLLCQWESWLSGKSCAPVL